MRPIEITDPQDPRIACYVDIRQARAASARAARTRTFIAEGRMVVDRLIDSDYPIESILVQQGSHQRYCDRIGERAPIFMLPREMIRQVVGFDFHRGVLACGLRREMSEVAKCQTLAPSTVCLAMMGITEQENMGSMLRSAAALGIDHIFLGPGTIDPLSRRVIRVSMGTVFQHQFYRFDDPVIDLHRLHQNGVRTVASTLSSDSQSIESYQRDARPVVLLIGNEAKGIDEAVQAIATDRVTIPMADGVDSLNASVAAAILMYQFAK